MSDGGTALRQAVEATGSCPTCGQILGRKVWYRSNKVRCAWIASAFPIAAALVYIWTEMLVPTALVTMAMTPFLMLGGGEAWHDAIKIKGGK